MNIREHQGDYAGCKPALQSTVAFRQTQGSSPVRGHGNAEGWDCMTKGGLKRAAERCSLLLLSAEKSYSPLAEAILDYDCPDGKKKNHLI